MDKRNANVKSEEFSNELQAELVLMRSMEDDSWVPADVNDQDLLLVSWL